MAEGNQEDISCKAPCEVVVMSDVSVMEKLKIAVIAEKELPPQPEPELEKTSEKEEEKEEAAAEEKVAELASFKEESNKVDDLIDPKKKALDEFKIPIQESLDNHQFTDPPPAKEEEKNAPTTTVPP